MTRLRRAVVAMPDAAAAALFLWCWVAPLALHSRLVGFLVLVLLIEFVVMQAGPFLGTVVYGEKIGLQPRQRLRTAAILGFVYLLLAALAGASFDAWFPFLIFVWLFAAKTAAAVLGRDPNATGREPEMTIWIFSASFFFGAVFATMFLPFPTLGITQSGEFYGLRGRYEWANFPHKAIAAGFLYFFALASLRLLGGRTELDLSRPDVTAESARVDST